jgi:predicted nucleic-acid-binding protein
MDIMECRTFLDSIIPVDGNHRGAREIVTVIGGKRLKAIGMDAFLRIR